MAKYISAEIAKKALAESDLIPRYAESCKPITDRIIDSLPSADVEPVRHGRWKPVFDAAASGETRKLLRQTRSPAMSAASAEEPGLYRRGKGHGRECDAEDHGVRRLRHADR